MAPKRKVLKLTKNSNSNSSIECNVTSSAASKSKGKALSIVVPPHSATLTQNTYGSENNNIDKSALRAIRDVRVKRDLTNNIVVAHIKIEGGTDPSSLMVPAPSETWWSDYMIVEDLKPTFAPAVPEVSQEKNAKLDDGVGSLRAFRKKINKPTTSGPNASSSTDISPVQTDVSAESSRIVYTATVSTTEVTVKTEQDELFVESGIVDNENSSVRSVLRDVRIKVEPTETTSSTEQRNVPMPPTVENDEAAITIKYELEDSYDSEDLELNNSWLEDEEADDLWDSVDNEDIDNGQEDSSNHARDDDADDSLAHRKKLKILERKRKLKTFRLESIKPLKVKTNSSTSNQSSNSDPYNYMCPFCPFTTTYVVQMKRHRSRHVSEGALNCKQCEFTTKHKDEFKEHLIKHYQEMSDSDQEQSDQDMDEELDEEEEEVDDEEEEEEEIDEVQFDSNTSDQREVLIYQKPLIPNTMPATSQGMVTNVIAVPETRMFEKILDLRCKYCPFFTTYKSVMNQHKSIHQAEGVMYCPQCDFSTRSKEEYKTHLMKHYQRDSFTCKFCGYSTISQYLYHHHIVKHSEKTYSCSHCNYSTGFKKAFKYHLLKHSAEKLLRCKHCPFITKYRHNYRQHVATHTGKGLMFCDFCSFYSAWETNFSRHLARHKMEEEARILEEQARLEAEEALGVS